MSRGTKFKKLLEPLEIRNFRLKNRIVKAPYSSTNADKDGYVTESAVYHYDSVARGGVGMFITESTAVDPLGVSGCPRMAIYDDSFIPGLRKLASVVHKYNCPVIMHSCISQPEGRANVRRRYQNSVVDEFRARFLSLVERYRKPFDEQRKLELRCKISKLNRHILMC